MQTQEPNATCQAPVFGAQVVEPQGSHSPQSFGRHIPRKRLPVSLSTTSAADTSFLGSMKHRRTWRTLRSESCRCFAPQCCAWPSVRSCLGATLQPGRESKARPQVGTHWYASPMRNNTAMPNTSFERTRHGSPLQAFISFWALRVLPQRASQLKR